MPLYSNATDILNPIKETPFRLEKDIQKITEKNLSLVFGYEFVRSEFTIHDFRIDTLAYDKEANAFVVIEYKKSKSFSVIDQGYAYLSLMLNNKADFILEYNENKKNTLKRNDIDWSQSKVLFISPSFTNYQKQSINFKDLPIELWTIKKYDNNTILYDQIQAANARESVKTISRKNEAVEQVNKEIKVYTEEEHLKRASDEIKELYEKFKEALSSLDHFEIKSRKKYVAFVSGSNVVDIHPQKNSLKIWINLKRGELDDAKGLARDVSSVGHWGNGDYEVQFSDDENLEYLISLAKQSWKKNKK